jgi:DNA-binding MarR family transcriptional regulator
MIIAILPVFAGVLVVTLAGKAPLPRTDEQHRTAGLQAAGPTNLSGWMSTPLDPIAEAARQWEVHWGADTVAPMTAVTSVMRAYQILLARLNVALGPRGLTYQRYEALMLLYYSRAGALPMGKMGVRLQLHQTSVTSLVDGLEKLGLAERGPHPTDRRTTLVSITDRGRAVALEATRDLNAMQFGTTPLTEAELVRLGRLLRRLCQ